MLPQDLNEIPLKLRTESVVFKRNFSFIHIRKKNPIYVLPSIKVYMYKTKEIILALYRVNQKSCPDYKYLLCSGEYN